MYSLIEEKEMVQEELERQFPGHKWECCEIGTGNINFIYLAKSASRKVIVKKDLHFARINPEKYPLPVDRLLYEYRAFVQYQKIAPEFVPEIYFFNFDRSMLAMEYLTPHALLRQALLNGIKYPQIGQQLGSFLARALYFSSRYHLSEKEWEDSVAQFVGNTSMRNIILEVNFTDPFYGSSVNWWSSPELDPIVAEIQSDPQIKTLVGALKEKFINLPEALAHGDLHTGSILVSHDDTKVIDTEFATYAPIAFDIGMLMANFAMPAFAAKPHNLDRDYLAEMTCAIWDAFATEFRRLWKYKDISVDKKLDEVWTDTLQLMGVEMIRRTIGVAHNADFESIADLKTKVSVEEKALRFAKKLIVSASKAIPNTKILKQALGA